MKRQEIHELPILDIDKAIKASQDYIKELEELKQEGLTNRQAERLYRFAQELIPSPDSEE